MGENRTGLTLETAIGIKFFGGDGASDVQLFEGCYRVADFSLVQPLGHVKIAESVAILEAHIQPWVIEEKKGCLNTVFPDDMVKGCAGTRPYIDVGARAIVYISEIKW